MIQIARVDYPNLPPDLRRLLVRRAQGTGPVSGVHIEPLDVDAGDGSQRRALGARIDDDAQDPRTVLLDAALAEHVLAAIPRLLASTDPDRAEQAGSPWAWEVEVDWGGVVSHHELHGVPSDEALVGVLEIVASLLDAADEAATAPGS